MEKLKKSVLFSFIPALLSAFLKRLLFCSTISVVYVLPLFCGDPVTYYYYPSYNYTYIRTSGGSYYQDIDAKVGYETSTAKKYRKAMQFDVSNIPSSATINSCEISFMSGTECGSQDGTIRFTQMSYNWPTYWYQYQTIYDQIATGTLFSSISITNLTTYTLALPSFVDIIQDAIESPNKLVALGAYNQYENPGYGTSFEAVQLKVVFTPQTPPPVTNLHTTLITSGKIVLAWNASSGDVTGYKVYKNGALYGTTSNTTMQICNIYPGSSYSFYVKAYNAYGDGDPSSTINPSTLSSTISGPDLVCTTGSYQVSNVPAGSTLTWTPPSNLTIASGYGNHDNPCSFQKYTNGNGSLVAAITSGCENYNLSKQVHTGPYSSSDYPVSGPSSAQCYSYVYYSIPQLSGVTSINWTWPIGWTYISGQNTRYLTLRTGTYGGGVGAGVNNTCGQSGSYSMVYTAVYGCYGYYLVITPNPASDEVNITLKETESTISSNDTLSTNPAISEKAQDFKVIITDNMGLIYYSGTKHEKSFSVSVQNLKNGNYFVVVENGKERYSASLVILH